MKIVKSSFELRMLGSGKDILAHIEWAGKTCYKSENSITDESAEQFIRKVPIGLGHESMLEHCVITAKLVCDLGISQEGTRHRLVHVDDDVVIDMEWDPAVSQESTRFCNYSKNKFSSEISFIDCTHHFKNPESIAVWLKACEDAEKNYLQLIELGETPQFARSVLIRSCKTEMTLTANLREWRKFFELRAAG